MTKIESLLRYQTFEPYELDDAMSAAGERHVAENGHLARNIPGEAAGNAERERIVVE